MGGKPDSAEEPFESRGTRMKTALVGSGAGVLLLGVLIAIWANTTLAPAQAAATRDCYMFNPNPAACAADLATVSTYSALFWTGIIVVVLGIVLLVLGVALSAVDERPSFAPVVAPPYPPACPRCGRALQWVAPHGRWYCPTENVYL